MSFCLNLDKSPVHHKHLLSSITKLHLYPRTNEKHVSQSKLQFPALPLHSTASSRYNTNTWTPHGPVYFFLYA